MLYALSLHDALPICRRPWRRQTPSASACAGASSVCWRRRADGRSEEHTSELQSQSNLVCRLLLEKKNWWLPRSISVTAGYLPTFPERSASRPRPSAASWSRLSSACFIMASRPPSCSTLFPSTTLFRSADDRGAARRRRLPPAPAPQACVGVGELMADRKSTRLNSSHSQTSYAVFCLKKKTGGSPAQFRSQPDICQLSRNDQPHAPDLQPRPGRDCRVPASSWLPALLHALRSFPPRRSSDLPTTVAPPDAVGFRLRRRLKRVLASES